MANPVEELRERLPAITSQSDTPLIRWSILAIAVIAVWFWIVEPLQVWNDELGEQVGRNADKVARLLALEKNASLWIEAKTEANIARVRKEKLLFVTTSDTQAQAQIQFTLRAMALANNLSIESQKLIPAEPLVPVGHRLAVEIGLRGELIDVLYFLDTVSRAAKLLVIDQWIVQIDRFGRAYIRSTVSGIRPVKLEAEADD